MLGFTCGGQKVTSLTWFSPSTLMWGLGLDLRLSGLYSEHFHSPSHLTGPH